MPLSTHNRSLQKWVIPTCTNNQTHNNQYLKTTQKHYLRLTAVFQGEWVSELEFNVPFQHKHGYIRDERSGMESYPYPVKEG